MDEYKAAISRLLSEDSFLVSLWSGTPECDIFPYQQSGHLKALLVTVFLKEAVINRETVGNVISRIAGVVGPQMQQISEFRVLEGWIGGGDSSDRYFRIMRFAILQEALGSPSLQFLAQHMHEEYYTQEGISFLRYYPL